MRILLAGLGSCLAAAAFAAADPAPPRIEGLADRLSSGPAEKRRQAEETLREAGAAAFREVARAAVGEAVEGRVRARRILAGWNWPTPELVARCGECPPDWQAALLAEALKHPVPVEMDPVEVELLPPQRHLERQAGLFAAVEAMARLPRDLAIARLRENLADADVPRYLTLTAVGEIGGPEAVELLLAHAGEDSTAGWVSPPALARLGRADVLEKAIERSQARIDRRTKLDADTAVALYNHACLLALAGRPDQVRDPLERALRDGEETDAAWARIDPDFRSVRDTPWFREVIGRYGGFGIPEAGETSQDKEPE